MASVETAGDKIAAAMVALDCRGMNFYRIDRDVRDLLELYMDPRLRVAWSRILIASANLPAENSMNWRKLPTSIRRCCIRAIVSAATRIGSSIHPAYREMERIAFGEFGLHAMAHRPGVLGWPEPLPPHREVRLPVSVRAGRVRPDVSDQRDRYRLDARIEQLRQRGAEEALPRRECCRRTSTTMCKGAQFMTEQAGGSDVGATAQWSRNEKGISGGSTATSGSAPQADGDVALLLARPEGAPAGTRGLGLFLMPRRLENGARNSYRIVRLKDKLGTRSMASGEIVLEGAIAYLLGEIDRGFKQMMDMVNLVRLSHGVRAAGDDASMPQRVAQVARHSQRIRPRAHRACR